MQTKGRHTPFRLSKHAGLLLLFLTAAVVLATRPHVSAAERPSAEGQPSHAPVAFAAPSVKNVVEAQVRVASDETRRQLAAWGLWCPTAGLCQLELDDVQLQALHAAGAEVSSVVRAVKVSWHPGRTGRLASSALPTTWEYGQNGTDYPIPDLGIAVSRVSITSAPQSAKVTDIKYRLRVEHTFPQDLVLRLRNSTGSKEKVLWNRLGGTTDGGYDDDVDDDDDIFLSERLESVAFDNESVNQQWALWAEDWATQDTGYIDRVELWIYYAACVPPAAPTLISPADSEHICDATPWLNWSDVGTSPTYYLQVDNNFSFSSPEIAMYIGVQSDFQTTTALAPGTYYWRVRAAEGDCIGEWSTRYDFEVESTPSAPTLYTLNMDRICDTTPTFDWSDVSGAQRYQLQLDDNSDFGSLVLYQNHLTQSQYTPSLPLSPDTYHWRVRAWTSWCPSPWAEHQTTIFVVPQPALTAPAAGSSTCDSTPTFSWQACQGCAWYDIQVDNDPAFNSPEYSSGTSQTSRTLSPSLQPGTYYWRVRGSTGGEPVCYSEWSSARQITVIATPSTPTLVSPAHGARTCDTTPLLEWQACQDCAYYYIELDDDPGFGSPERFTVSAPRTDQLVTPDLPSGTYYWRMQSASSGTPKCYSDWSPIRQFMVDRLPPPTLISPLDGSRTCDGKPTFRWSSCQGCTNYRIEVDSDISFGSPVVADWINVTSKTPSSPLSPGRYYWRVRGRGNDASGTCYSDWAATWDVVVESRPGEAILLAPADGSETCDTTPRFDWSDVPEATIYRIRVQLPDGSAAVDDTSTSSAYTPQSALAPGRYDWYVRAENNCGGGSWSSHRSLTILGTPGVPGSPSPAGGARVPIDVNLDWADIPGATEYRVHFGTSPSPPVAGTTTHSRYDLPILTRSTDYYWRVVALGACGQSSGPVWHFRTVSFEVYLPAVLRVHVGP